MKPLLIDTTLTLFDGPSYVQYDTETGQSLTRSARSFAEGWAIPFRKIDAAVRWDLDTVYFLSAMQVVRYRLSTGQVDAGYPKVIPFYWRGLWPSDIDAVLRLDQQAYFFRKEQFIQYDLAAGRASLHSAQPIAGRWRGLPKRITGAVPISADYVLFFREDDCYVYNLPANHTVAGPVPFADVLTNGFPAFLDSFRQQKKSGKVQ